MPAQHEPNETLVARILDYNQAKRELWDKYPDANDDDAYDPDTDPKHPGWSVKADWEPSC